MTRPDGSYAISTLAQYSAEPTKTHLKIALRVLCYLKKTREKGICYDGNGDLRIDTHSDADWAGCKETRKSTTGYIIRAAGAAVSYISKKQHSVSNSSTETEYVAAGATAREIVWFQNLLNSIKEGLGINIPTAYRPMQLYLDNQAAIAISKNPQYHSRMKHIDVQHHYIRERVLEEDITPSYIPSADNAADILTKPLSKEKHDGMKILLGIL